MDPQSSDSEEVSSDSSSESSDSRSESSDNEQQEMDNNARNNMQPQEEVRHYTSHLSFCIRFPYNRRVEVLGEGSYGKVHKARDTNRNGTQVAIKIFNTNKEHNRRSFKGELEILKKIKQYRSVNNYTVTLLAYYHNEQVLNVKLSCLALTLLCESLDVEVEAKGGLPLKEIRKLGLQIAEGLEFLKRLKIIHADLTPGNIMFTNPRCKQLRIIDFGYSFEKGADIQHHIQTAEYRAMEVFLQKMPYTNAIDIWSFGCVLAYMYTAEHLFKARNIGFERKRKTVNQIVRTLGMPPRGMLSETSPCENYFKKENRRWKQNLRLWEENGRETPGSRNVAQFLDLTEEQRQSDEYLEFVELINEMLVYRVRGRIDVANILRSDFFLRPDTPE